MSDAALRVAVGAYRPFPTVHNHRFYLTELGSHLDLLRAIWRDPHSLNPQHAAERATREIGLRLEDLAEQLEDAGHDPGTLTPFQFLYRIRDHADVEAVRTTEKL